ncbi:MAG TPA: pyrroline-5-carboxylate reductase [bacterium]
MQIAFIGGGNMGRALAAAVIRQGVSKPSEVLVVEPVEVARDAVGQLGCTVAEVPDERVTKAAIVLLAVKPQQAREAMAELKPFLANNQVIVSIMAGVKLSALQEGLGHETLVRVMPNTPAQVGLGMNVYHAAPDVTPRQLEAVETVLKASGEVLAVPSEDAIDAATAVSGSGPAYVFYLAEHWMAAAIKLGFTEPEAAQLVQQTLIGATALWRSANVPPATLREQVTSKGGTTAAALEEFNGKGVGDAVQVGIARAYQRAKELGR